MRFLIMTFITLVFVSCGKESGYSKGDPIVPGSWEKDSKENQDSDSGDGILTIQGVVSRVYSELIISSAYAGDIGVMQKVEKGGDIGGDIEKAQMAENKADLLDARKDLVKVGVNTLESISKKILSTNYYELGTTTNDPQELADHIISRLEDDFANMVDDSELDDLDKDLTYDNAKISNGFVLAYAFNISNQLIAIRIQALEANGSYELSFDEEIVKDGFVFISAAKLKNAEIVTRKNSIFLGQESVENENIDEKSDILTVELMKNIVKDDSVDISRLSLQKDKLAVKIDTDLNELDNTRETIKATVSKVRSLKSLAPAVKSRFINYLLGSMMADGQLSLARDFRDNVMWQYSDADDLASSLDSDSDAYLKYIEQVKSECIKNSFIESDQLNVRDNLENIGVVGIGAGVRR